MRTGDLAVGSCPTRRGGTSREGGAGLSWQHGTPECLSPMGGAVQSVVFWWVILGLACYRSHLLSSTQVNVLASQQKHNIYWYFLGCYGDGDSLVAKSCPTLVTPWTVASQTPLSIGLSRKKYWSRLPCPSPGDLPDPEIEPRFPALQTVSLPTELHHVGKLL